MAKFGPNIKLVSDYIHKYFKKEHACCWNVIVVKQFPGKVVEWDYANYMAKHYVYFAIGPYYFTIYKVVSKDLTKLRLTQKIIKECKFEIIFNEGMPGPLTSSIASVTKKAVRSVGCKLDKTREVRNFIQQHFTEKKKCCWNAMIAKQLPFSGEVTSGSLFR